MRLEPKGNTLWFTGVYLPTNVPTPYMVLIKKTWGSFYPKFFNIPVWFDYIPLFSFSDGDQFILC